MSVGGEGPVPLVYSPRSLGEALALFVPNPQAQVFAGGTGRPSAGAQGRVALPPVTVSLHLVEDLRRIVYGERWTDLGAALSLNQLLTVAPAWLPTIVKDGVRGIGNSSLRNLATLGGNLCGRDGPGDLFPILHILGAQFEVRNLRGSRWVTSAELAEAGRLALGPGEILTRVRIPQDPWPFHLYERIGHLRTPDEERLALAVVARAKGGQIEALRLAFHLPPYGLVRAREIEADLTGRPLPLSPRVRAQALVRLEEALERLDFEPSAFQLGRLGPMVRWVLSRLGDD